MPSILSSPDRMENKIMATMSAARQGKNNRPATEFQRRFFVYLNNKAKAAAAR